MLFVGCSFNCVFVVVVNGWLFMFDEKIDFNDCAILVVCSLIELRLVSYKINDLSFRSICC